MVGVGCITEILERLATDVTSRSLITQIPRRQEIYRYSITAGLKIWLTVNVESLRLWDGIIWCLLFEVLRYVIECGLFQAEKWTDDLARVVLLYVVPLPVMVAYRGVLYEVIL
jgi:hypothetical protein